MDHHIEYGFGPQLVLDLKGCNKKKLGDEVFIRSLLDRLPAMIDMTKISEPSVMYYPGKEDSFDHGGCSGFVLIAESHIAVHTFVDQGHAFFDIFSCKTFDCQKAIQILREELEAEDASYQIFDRGREFPKMVPIVKEIVKKDRRHVKNPKHFGGA